MFSLSVEEVGLLLSQLPGSSVELSHHTWSEDASAAEKQHGFEQLSGDAVEKVMTIEPGEGATLTFKIDYMKGGLGGQTPPGMEGLPVSSYHHSELFLHDIMILLRATERERKRSFDIFLFNTQIPSSIIFP